MNKIPYDDLMDMLKAACWFSGDDPNLDGQKGYSLEVNEETKYKDVLIRRAILYPTQEEAIAAHWINYYVNK